MICMIWLLILELRLKDIVRLYDNMGRILVDQLLFVDMEIGFGVFEIVFGYIDVFRMVDNVCLFKFVVKSIGMKYGIFFIFMVKFWGDVSKVFFFVFC